MCSLVDDLRKRLFIAPLISLFAQHYCSLVTHFLLSTNTVGLLAPLFSMLTVLRAGTGWSVGCCRVELSRRAVWTHTCAACYRITWLRNRRIFLEQLVHNYYNFLSEQIMLWLRPSQVKVGVQSGVSELRFSKFNVRLYIVFPHLKTQHKKPSCNLPRAGSILLVTGWKKTGLQSA